MRRAVRQLMLAPTLALLAAVLLAAPARAGEPMTLALQWVPQAQFAGFYVALADGLYEQAGIDLSIEPGGPDLIASERLEEGGADFATMFLATGIQRRAAGAPVVNICQLVQQSALMLVAKKSSGITGFKDLDGRRVGLWSNEFQLQPRALFKRLGLDVTLVPQTDSLDLFLLGGVDAASAMWYNEYHRLLTYGLDPDDLVPLFFAEAGLNFPEDGVYALESTIRERPELCARFVEATLEGWRAAFEDPERALDIVLAAMSEARIGASRNHQRWMLLRMRDVILGRDAGTSRPSGQLLIEDFDRVLMVLLNNGLIEHGVDYQDFFRDVRHGG